MPCCIAEKLGRPLLVERADLAVEHRVVGVFSALTIAVATSAKRAVRSLSLRDRSSHSPPRTYASAR